MGDPYSIVTMRLAPLWRYGRLKFFQEQRSVVGPQYYTDLIYSSSLR